MNVPKSLFFLGLYLLISCSPQETSTTVNYSDESVEVATLFAKGIISTEENSEFSLMFTPNGRKVYFSRRAPNEKQKIYETEFHNGQWIKPIQSEFSTDRDETPSITPNGELFFFGSERDIPNKPNQGNFDMNVWMMNKTNSGWSKPEPLPFPVNDVQIEGEEWPSSNNNFLYSIDNETFYFTTMVRDSESIKLYRTNYNSGKFSDPTVINGLFDDAKYWIYSAVLSPDGQFLIFNSYGVPEGSGGEDIFISKRIGNSWSKAKPIGELINTKDEESSPRFSRDGKYFFFSRAENFGNYEYGEWSIFYIETEYLNLNNLFN